MLSALFTVDGSICSTEDYEREPDKYRGRIICGECKKKAWYIKSFMVNGFPRTACFAARHPEECSASTVVVNDELEPEEQPNDSDLIVDLDRARQQSITTAAPSDKHSDEEADWLNKKAPEATGNGKSVSMNKSLRQILSHLQLNPQYADNGRTIQVVADSGRVLLDGKLSRFLVRFDEITRDHVGRLMIFWGAINNINTDKDDALWLNYGDNYAEPSIYLDKNLKLQLKRNFKLKELDELEGAHAIVVGNVVISPNGKAIIRFSYTKYISFRKPRIEVKDSEEAVSETV